MICGAGVLGYGLGFVSALKFKGYPQADTR